MNVVRRAHSRIWCTCLRHRLIDRYAAAALHARPAGRVSQSTVRSHFVRMARGGSCGAALAAMEAVQPKRAWGAAGAICAHTALAATLTRRIRLHTHAARRSVRAAPPGLGSRTFLTRLCAGFSAIWALRQRKLFADPHEIPFSNMYLAMRPQENPSSALCLHSRMSCRRL